MIVLVPAARIYDTRLASLRRELASHAVHGPGASCSQRAAVLEFPAMRLQRVLLAFVIGVCLGGGFGLAALGKPVRAFAWFTASLLAAVLGTVLVPWLLVAVPIAVVGCWVDTFVHAYREDSRFDVATPWPWVILASSVVIAVALRLFVVEAFKLPSSSMYPTLQIGDHVVIDKLHKHPERGDLIVFVYPCDPARDYDKRVIALAGDTVEVRCNVVYVNGKAVPNELVEDGKRCSYDDMIEAGPEPAHWEPRPCSRYRETLDGRTYDVFHDPDRPQRDAAQATLDHGDMRDFPQRGMMPSCANAADEPGDSSEWQAPPGKIIDTKPEAEAKACDQQSQYVVPAGSVFVLGDNRYNSNDSRVWGAVPLANVKGRITTIWWSRHLSRLGAVH
jgi:signal peptidase I